jgi:hypothetical protein
MKKNLLISSVLLLIFSVAEFLNVEAQTTKNMEAQSDTEKSKTQKEKEKQAEREEKKRLESPVQVEIKAPPEKIIPLLISGFQSWNYKLKKNKPNRLTFKKDTSSRGYNVTTGEPVFSKAELYFKIEAAITETSGATIVNIETTEISGGRVYNSNKSPSYRRQLEALLLKIKTAAEGN